MFWQLEDSSNILPAAFLLSAIWSWPFCSIAHAHQWKWSLCHHFLNLSNETIVMLIIFKSVGIGLYDPSFREFVFKSSIEDSVCKSKWKILVLFGLANYTIILNSYKPVYNVPNLEPWLFSSQKLLITPYYSGKRNEFILSNCSFLSVITSKIKEKLIFNLLIEKNDSFMKA